MIARELGGRRFALLLSALAFIAVPVYLNDGSVMTTNCLEPLLWMGCVYFAILAIKRDDPRYWLWLGVAAGVGLEEKYSVAVLGFAIVVGLLLTEQRRVFTRNWIWLGGALAAFAYDWLYLRPPRPVPVGPPETGVLEPRAGETSVS